MKTVAFKMPNQPTRPDEWVHSAPEPAAVAAQTPAGPMKRFTLDVSLELHSRIKVECARRQQKMADVLRDLLERKFPPTAT